MTLPTVKVDDITILASDWKFADVNFDMKNSYTSNLSLEVKMLHSVGFDTDLLKVNIQNCTLGNWQFQNLRNLRIKNCRLIQANASEYVQPLMYIYQSSALIENVDIKSITFMIKRTLALFIFSDSHIIINVSRFTGNTGHTPGLIYVSDNSTLIMKNCEIKDNSIFTGEPSLIEAIIFLMTDLL